MTKHAKFISGQVAPKGDRSWVIMRSPRAGSMKSNGPTPAHPYVGTHSNKTAGKPNVVSR